jgi:hypothetical protein
MYQIFDLGEQIAELNMLSTKHRFMPLRLLAPQHWAEFILEDAKEMLKEKHFGGLNKRGDRMVKLLMKICNERHLEGDLEDLYKFLHRLPTEAELHAKAMAELNNRPKASLTQVADVKPADPTPEELFLNELEDGIDELYYEIGNEIQDCVNGFYTRGDIWTVDLTCRSMIFSFCCRRSVVEAAVRESGGAMSDFIRHFTA